jgi:limonene-1,2-epoxide hydrolase
METKQIAARLKALCERGEFETCLNELFAPDAVSIEPYAANGFEKETKGLPAIRKKGELWNSLVEEYHGSSISEPIVADGSFALTMNLDVTMKGKGRSTMTELCIYKVKDGKIISEEFVM